MLKIERISLAPVLPGYVLVVFVVCSISLEYNFIIGNLICLFVKFVWLPISQEDVLGGEQ